MTEFLVLSVFDSLQDLLAPSNKPTATAELRQRQLTFLGKQRSAKHPQNPNNESFRSLFGG